jgi:transcriptional regulator with XRE-family HTH domain
MPTGEKYSSPEKKAFARTLSELRQEQHLTQETLAFESGYHPKYISLLERGLYSPSSQQSLSLQKSSKSLGQNSWAVLSDFFRGPAKDAAKCAPIGDKDFTW